MRTKSSGAESYHLPLAKVSDERCEGQVVCKRSQSAPDIKFPPKPKNQHNAFGIYIFHRQSKGGLVYYYNFSEREINENYLAEGNKTMNGTQLTQPFFTCDSLAIPCN